MEHKVSAEKFSILSHTLGHGASYVGMAKGETKNFYFASPETKEQVLCEEMVQDGYMRNSGRMIIGTYVYTATESGMDVVFSAMRKEN